MSSFLERHFHQANTTATLPKPSTAKAMDLRLKINGLQGLQKNLKTAASSLAAKTMELC